MKKEYSKKALMSTLRVRFISAVLLGIAPGLFTLLLIYQSAVTPPNDLNMAIFLSLGMFAFASAVAFINDLSLNLTFLGLRPTKNELSKYLLERKKLLENAVKENQEKSGKYINEIEAIEQELIKLN